MRALSDALSDGLTVDTNSTPGHVQRNGNRGAKAATSPQSHGPGEICGCPRANGSHGTQGSESATMLYDSEPLEVLSKRDLIALLRQRPATLDEGDIRLLRQAIFARLSTLSRRVREGQFVMEASEFARWLDSSGLSRVASFGSPKAEGEFRQQIRGVLRDCERAWKGTQVKGWVERSEIEAVNQKLDNLSSLVERALSSFPGPKQEGRPGERPARAAARLSNLVTH